MLYVVSCQVSIHSDGRYGFVEFRSPEYATAALQLNGQINLMGQALSIGRPASYVDPNKVRQSDFLQELRTAFYALLRLLLQKITASSLCCTAVPAVHLWCAALDAAAAHHLCSYLRSMYAALCVLCKALCKCNNLV